MSEAIPDQGFGPAAGPDQALIDEILAEEAKFIGDPSKPLVHRLSVPHRPRFVLVFAAPQDRDEINEIAKASKDQAAFQAAYLINRCVAIEAVRSDGSSKPLQSETGLPLTLGQEFAELLKAPAVKATAAPLELMAWICKTYVAVGGLYARLDAWEAGAVREVEDRLLGESVAGQS